MLESTIQLTNDPNTNISIIIQAALKSFPDNKLLADLTVCQAILESRLNGEPSELALKYNNLFGIKGIGTAGYVTLLTHEEENGRMIEVKANFAKNVTLQDSIDQHKRLLEYPRYADLWGATTFTEVAQYIREDGYATDPNYSNLLIEIYNQYCRTNV